MATPAARMAATRRSTASREPNETAMCATLSRVYFESERSKACRPKPSTALEKISKMIPHLVDFLIKYNDCAIMEKDKKMFPIMDNLTPARRSVCL